VVVVVVCGGDLMSCGGRYDCLVVAFYLAGQEALS
jgi:hypothetical protein